MSIALIWTTPIDFFSLLVKLIQPSGLMWTGYWGKCIKSCASSLHTFMWTQPNRTWPNQWCGFMEGKGVTHAHICAYWQSRMCEYKHWNKNSLDHIFFPPSQWRLFSPHVPSDRHAHTRSGKHSDEGRGFLTKADQGQQGLFDQWRRPTGHWALTAYATAPTYREINPHFISHICSTAPK